MTIQELINTLEALNIDKDTEVKLDNGDAFLNEIDEVFFNEDEDCVVIE